MPSTHPLVRPFDHVNMICPVGGELRYGASLPRVQTIRERAAAVILDAGDKLQPGDEFGDVYESPTCGTVEVRFKVGVNEQDGLPAIWEVKNYGVPVPTLGHRMIRRKLSDQLAIGTAATDVTNLEVAVTAGRQMHFRCWLPVRTSAAAVAASVSVNGPAAAVLIYETVEWTAPTASFSGGALAYDSFSANTTGNGPTPKAFKIEGSVVFAADGIFVPRIRAEPGSGGTCDVLQGAFMEFDLI